MPLALGLMRQTHPLKINGMTYQVEIRDFVDRVFSCSCPDFRTAGLGTCKHVEATLIWLKRRQKSDFRAAGISGSTRIDLVPAGDTLRIERNLSELPPSLRPLFDPAGRLQRPPTETPWRNPRLPRRS